MAAFTPPDAGTVLWQREAEAHDDISARTFGFWLYMMSDALIFAALFAAYAVLDHAVNAAGGPGAHQVVHPLDGFWQTLAVLSSVFTYSLATVAMKLRSRPGTILYIVISLLLGCLFLGLEVSDFLFLAATAPAQTAAAFSPPFSCSSPRTGCTWCSAFYGCW